MNFHEFILWTEDKDGKWELHDGLPVQPHDPAKGHSERIGHINAKFAIALALHDALKEKSANCHVLSDGATIKIDDRKVSYEPDALVYSGTRIDPNELVDSRASHYCRSPQPVDRLQGCQHKAG